MNPAVGIDLGTTNTVVATQTDTTGAQILDVPQPVDDRNILDTQPWIKSAVYFESTESAVVGAFAARHPAAFRSIKSRMGTPWRVPHPCNPGTFVDASYISGHILRAAFEAIVGQFPDWDREAIITVPASFNTDQRTDTLRATQLAGFGNVRLLDEPTAAFYYYFNQQRNALQLDTPINILVFDFGGGTLDVSIIVVRRNEDGILIDAVGRSRYNNLGGDDIDLGIATFLLGCWEFRTGQELDSRAQPLRREVFRLLIERAQLFKEEVEDHLASGLDFPEFFISEKPRTEADSCTVDMRMTMSRSQYDEITCRFLQDKQEVNIFRPIGQAIDVAEKIRPEFSKQDLDFVLYTGGASRMGAVKSALDCFFSPKQCFSLSDDEACNTVAIGAACCRFDEMYRREEVIMTARMLESLLTRSEDGDEYIPIVPIHSQPKDAYERIQREFRTQRDIIKLKLPLFRGTGPADPQLAPMRDFEVELDRIVERDVPYHLHFRMTRDKTVELKVVFRPRSGDVEATSQLHMDAGAPAASDILRLAQVNHIRVV